MALDNSEYNAEQKYFLLRPRSTVKISPAFLIATSLTAFFQLSQLSNAWAQPLDKKPASRLFRLNGNLSTSAVNYVVSGIDRRREPFSWFVTGNVNFSIFGIDVPFSTTLSEQQRAFRQPFNQYGMSPRYKWVTVHAGYRSMQFSQYTLAGARFRGAGFELNPGILRLAGMFGRFQQAVEEDTTATYRVTPAYKRTGFGFKLGLGSERTHFDIILFKAKDDTASLKRVPKKVDLLPTENFVLGLNTRIYVARQLQIEGEFACSALNPICAHRKSTTWTTASCRHCNRFSRRELPCKQTSPPALLQHCKFRQSECACNTNALNQTTGRSGLTTSAQTSKTSPFHQPSTCCGEN
jgi:hypothetical protein